MDQVLDIMVKNFKDSVSGAKPHIQSELCMQLHLQASIFFYN